MNTKPRREFKVGDYVRKTVRNCGRTKIDDIYRVEDCEGTLVINRTWVNSMGKQDYEHCSCHLTWERVSRGEVALYKLKR